MVINRLECLELIGDAAVWAAHLDILMDVRFESGALYIVGAAAPTCGAETIISAIRGDCDPEARWAEVEGDLELQGFEITN
jgi:hypothetical protein